MKEEEKEIIVFEPLNKALFLCEPEKQTYLAPEVIENPVVLEQASKRRQLYSKINLLFEAVCDPEMDIAEALNKGLVLQSDLAEVYLGLADFLEADSYNPRIILYLPFELLPNLRLGTQRSPSLENATERFCQSFRQAFNKILLQKDVRANFIDGDIWESELGLGQQPLITKARELFPWLLERGLVEGEEIGGLGRLRGLEKLGESIVDIREGLKQELERAALRFRLGKPNNMTSERWEWQKQNEKERIIENYAKKMGVALKEKVVNQSDIEAFVRNGKQGGFSMLVGIRGIGYGLEEISKLDLERARKLMQDFDTFFTSLWEQGVEVRDEISIVLYHLFDRGVIEERYLTKFGLKKPDLEHPGLDNTELEELKKTLSPILRDKKFSEMFYPVFLLFGSRLKGYANLGADLDIAVFLKPETKWESRSGIEQILREGLIGKRGVGRVVEFWMEEDNGLKVRDVPLISSMIADPDFVHVLLGGLWLGEKKATERLYGEIMKGYLGLEDDGSRDLWLGNIEREVLQYRLLHKGYGRFYSKRGDGVGSFFDPGYRRLATKLFISKVFLP